MRAVENEMRVDRKENTFHINNKKDTVPHSI